MAKGLAFLYGTVAYLVFLVAFLYAIGFTGNVLVPKGIDAGTVVPVGQAILVNERQSGDAVLDLIEQDGLAHTLPSGI